MMFHFVRRVRTSDRVSGRWLAICLLGLAALPVLGASPAFGQALSRQQIHRLLAQRRLQAAALNITIQHEQVVLTRLESIAFPTLGVIVRIVTLQTALNQNLATLQTLDNQIVLLNQLLGLIDQMDAVNRKIQQLQRRIASLQGLSQGLLVRQRIGNLQETVGDLQQALAIIQGLIDTTQGQLIP
jgi:hypothetical protein